MRTVAFLTSTLASSAMALSSQSALIKLHTYQEQQSEHTLSRKFAKALEVKIEAYERAGLDIPQHITDTVLATLAGGGTDRASQFCPQPGGCQATISLEQVWNYGCWCMLSTPTGGAGNTLDPYDEACKKMSHCNRCAEGDDPTGLCDAATVGFQVDIDWDANNFALNADCSSANSGDECAEHLCACEINFLGALLDLLWSGATRTESFVRNSQFDSDQCIAQIDPIDGATVAPLNGDSGDGDNGDGDDPTATDAPDATVAPTDAPYVCCGIYPDRVLLGASQECCQPLAGFSTPFSAVTHECCLDGSVRGFGEC